MVRKDGKIEKYVYVMFKSHKNHLPLRYNTYTIIFDEDKKYYKEFENRVYLDNIEWLKKYKSYLKFYYFDKKQELDLFIAQEKELNGAL